MKKIYNYRQQIGQGLLGMFCLWLGYSGWVVYRYSLEDERRMADAAIVLGAGTYRNRPSPVLRERINHAILLYEEGYVPYIIFTGGQGQKSWEGVEAEVARQYALDQGVPAEAILIENQSTSTIGNLENAKKVGDEKGFDRYLIVSTPFHMKRAISMAKELGMDAYSSPTRTTKWISWFTRSRAYIRELGAYAVYLIEIDDFLRRTFKG